MKLSFASNLVVSAPGQFGMLNVCSNHFIITKHRHTGMYTRNECYICKIVRQSKEVEIFGSDDFDMLNCTM
jgi:hypothetical protein